MALDVCPAVRIHVVEGEGVDLFLFVRRRFSLSCAFCSTIEDSGVVLEFLLCGYGSDDGVARWLTPCLRAHDTYVAGLYILFVLFVVQRVPAGLHVLRTPAFLFHAMFPGTEQPIRI